MEVDATCTDQMFGSSAIDLESGVRWTMTDDGNSSTFSHWAALADIAPPKQPIEPASICAYTPEPPPTAGWCVTSLPTDFDYIPPDDEPNSDLLCSICLGWPVDPVVLDCPGEHMFCRRCIGTSFCPLDRQSFSKFRSPQQSVIDLFDRLHVRCGMAAKGCEWTGTRGNYASHHAICPFIERVSAHAQEFSVSLCAPGARGLCLHVNQCIGGMLEIIKVNHGPVERWNQCNPGLVVKHPDRIVAVNGIRGDSWKLLDMLKANEPLVLHILRAREFRISLRKAHAKSHIGLDVSDHGQSLLIRKVRPGVIEGLDPSYAVQVHSGDRIIEANGVRGESRKILTVISNELHLHLTLARLD